jgi:hypothetical protein
MPCDVKQIAYVREAALAGETGRDLFERDRHDGIDFNLAFFELVSPAGTNVRTHPDANASRDRTTSHTIAKVFREEHCASLARCLPLIGKMLFGPPHPIQAYRVVGKGGTQLASTFPVVARFSLSSVKAMKAMHISSVVCSPHETAFGGLLGLRRLSLELS